jgi:UDP-glucose 4-epimerase
MADDSAAGVQPSRVLVTGASGFIGRALVQELLSRGNFVRAAARSRSQAPSVANLEPATMPDLAGPIEWAPLLDGIQTVIHLAGTAQRSGRHESSYDQVIRVATGDLASACRRAAVRRLIYVSSIGAQTGSSANSVQTEDDAPKPATAYDRAKLAAEQCVRESGVASTILRPVLVYGTGVKGNMALFANLARLPIVLPFGAFRNRRSLLSRENLVDAICFCMASQATENETYVVSDLEVMTFAEALAVMRQAAGRRPRMLKISPRLICSAVSLVGFKGIWDRIGRDLIVSPNKLIGTGWRAKVDTPGGLRSMIVGMLGEAGRPPSHI